MSLTNTNILKISRLQKRFLKKRFLSELNKHADLFDKLGEMSSYKSQIDKKTNPEWYNKDLDGKFNLLTKLISTKDTVQKIGRVLARYYRYYNDPDIAQKLDARKFLCCFVMCGFPEIVLTLTKQELETRGFSYDSDIFFFSVRLVTMLRHLRMLGSAAGIGAGSSGGDTNQKKNNILPRFTVVLNMYTNALNSYLYVDKCRKIDEIAKQWYAISETKSEVMSSAVYSEEEKKRVAGTLDKSADRMIAMLHIIDKKFDVSYLQKYKELCDKVKDVMKKGFWDALTEELKGAKYDMLFKLLDEIRNELIMLKLNDKQYKDDMYEYIDLEFIKHKIDSGLMTPEELLKYTDYFIDKISELQAPSRDKVLRERQESIRQEVLSGKLMGAGLESIVPVVMGFVFEQIQVLKDDIYGFVAMKDMIGGDGFGQAD